MFPKFFNGMNFGVKAKNAKSLFRNTHRNRSDSHPEKGQALPLHGKRGVEQENDPMIPFNSRLKKRLSILECLLDIQLYHSPLGPQTERGISIENLVMIGLLNGTQTLSSPVKNRTNCALTHFFLLFRFKIAVALDIAKPDRKIPIVFFIMTTRVGLISGFLGSILILARLRAFIFIGDRIRMKNEGSRELMGIPKRGLPIRI
jgi:hypothetical protein